MVKSSNLFSCIRCHYILFLNLFKRLDNFVVLSKWVSVEGEVLRFWRNNLTDLLPCEWRTVYPVKLVRIWSFYYLSSVWSNVLLHFRGHHSFNNFLCVRCNVFFRHIDNNKGSNLVQCHTLSSHFIRAVPLNRFLRWRIWLFKW